MKKNTIKIEKNPLVLNPVQCTVEDKHIGIPFHGLNFHICHVGTA